MPKITETRFKYIVKNIYPPAGISRGVDNFIKELINHPEIKSLFECEPTECKFCGSSNTVVEHHDADNSDRVYCKTCCCQSSCKEIVDNSIKAYEVVEYESDKLLVPTTCKRDCSVYVNSVFCNKECKTNGLQNFAGHEVVGRSIRCLHKFNEGGEG